MKTKLIAVWHVEYYEGDDEPRVRVALNHEMARTIAYAMERQGCRYTAITGPHQHRVPT